MPFNFWVGFGLVFSPTTAFDSWKIVPKVSGALYQTPGKLAWVLGPFRKQSCILKKKIVFSCQGILSQPLAI